MYYSEKETKFYQYSREIDCVLIDSDGKSETLIELKSSSTEGHCLSSAKAIKQSNNKNVINKIVCTEKEFYKRPKELKDDVVLVSFTKLIEYLYDVYDVM